VFSSSSLDGLGLPEGATIASQLGVQAIGAFATAAWSGIASFVILKGVNLLWPLRVSAEQENEGLDLVLHEERGYSL
jgi:ammonium transporter, Amt family